MAGKSKSDMELEDFVRMLNMTSYEGDVQTGGGSNYYEGFTQVPREFDLEVSDFYDEDDGLDRGTFQFSADYEEQEDKRDFFAEYNASLGLSFDGSSSSSGSSYSLSSGDTRQREFDSDLDVIDLEDDIEEEIEDEPVEELVLDDRDVLINNVVTDTLERAISDCNDHLRKHRVECTPLIVALENADNLIKVRDMANDYTKNNAYAVVVSYLEKMVAYLVNLDKKIHEYAASDVEAEQKKAMLEKMMDINDGNILKLDEAVIKVWNLMPKTKQVEDTVVALEKVSSNLYDLANSYVDNDNMSLQYYSLNLIQDNRNRIIDEYEYLPFVRKAKAKEYKQELDGLRKSLDMTTNHYIGTMDEEKARLKAIEFEIQECSQVLENRNVFAKGNKKQSRERLEELAKEEQEAKDKLENLAREFDDMTKQINDNIELCESKLRWYRG